MCKLMANVLLLREPSQDGPDRYETAFSAAGYHPISIPVLKTFHTTIPHLRDIIQEGPKALGYHGVIITSKRSCDSWREALRLLSTSAPDDTHAIGWCLLCAFSKSNLSSSIPTGSGMVWDTILCRRGNYSFSLDRRLWWLCEFGSYGIRCARCIVRQCHHPRFLYPGWTRSAVEAPVPDRR